MGSLASFNLDIVIVMIVIFFITYSFYRGFYRSIKLFLQILLSITLIELINSKITNSLDFHKFNEKFINFASKLEKIIYISNKNLMSILLIYAFIFVIAFLLIHIVFMFFSPSAEDLIIKSPKLHSRVISSIVGLISSYLIVIVVIFGSLSIVPIDNSGISRAVINNPLKITTLEKYNEMNIELESSYYKYSYLIDLINGSTLEYELTQLKSISSKVYEVDLMIEEVIFPLLQSDEAKTIILDNCLENPLGSKGYIYALQDKSNYDLIIEKEITNPNSESIKSPYDFIIKNRDYIKLIFEIAYEKDDTDFWTLLEQFNQKSIEDYSEELKNLILASKFYYNINQLFIEVVESDLDDLSAYNLAINKTIQDNEKILQLSDVFINNYPLLKETVDPELQKTVDELLLMFKFFKSNYSRFIKFDPNLSFGLKLSLCKIKFNPEKDNLLDSPLVWADLNDAFDKSKTKVATFDGSVLVFDNYYNKAAFYSEYFFIELMDHFNYDKPINEDMIELFLERLNKKIYDDKFISEHIASNIIENLIIDQTSYSYLEKIYMFNLIEDEALMALYNSEYKFISLVVKEYIFENYLFN